MEFVSEPEKKIQQIVLLSITYCAGARYVSKKRAICGCRTHHGCPGLFPRRGNLVGDPGRERERGCHFCSKVALEALESGLGRNKAGQERSKHAFAFSASHHAARHIPCQCGATGFCDSLVSGKEEVCGQLQPQRMHVGGSCP